MMRKLTPPLVILFILLMAAPATAAVQLDVNGRTYSNSNLDIQEGVSIVPLTVISHILGCTITQEGNDIIIQENQNCLKMTMDSTTACFNDEEKQMPIAPKYIEGKVYVPFNFVCSCFGASVAWNSAQQTILVSYTETRDGMTAEELLTQASQKMMEANRYKMTLDMDIIMDIAAAQSGQDPVNISMQMNNISNCWVQTNPMLIYMQQDSNIISPGIDSQDLQNIQTEIVFNENGMYTNIPTYGWVKMDLPGINIEELMKMSYTQDAAASLQQMKDLGMSLSLANDQERNGQKYWVIDVAMGSDIFKSDYFKQFSSVFSTPDTSDMMQEVFDNMVFDFSYSLLINQNTCYTDFMDLQGTAKINMDIPDTETPASMAMDMDLKGNYTLSDFGVVFQVPDVSQAVDYNTIDLQN